MVGTNNWKEWKENTICKAHVFTYKNRVKSLNLEQQCSASSSGRKRQDYSLAMMSLASKGIRDYDKPTKSRGTCSQIQEAAKAAGFEMKKLQAYKVLRQINDDPIETHIGRYFLLTSILNAWQEDDTGGTYLLESLSASWNENLAAFRRMFLSPSFAKHAWRHCYARFVVLNGSFQTKGHFRHQLLLALTHDANDKLVLLAVALCDGNDEDNWAWFCDNLIRDFPRIQLVISPAKYVIESRKIADALHSVAAQ